MSDPDHVILAVTEAVDDIQNLDGFGPWQVATSEKFDAADAQTAAVYVEVIRPTGDGGHKLARGYLLAQPLPAETTELFSNAPTGGAR